MTTETPKEYFIERPLRMLYECRFVAVGLGKVSWETTRTMTELAHKVMDEPAIDVFEEVSKLLMVKDPTRGLELMVSTGLMKYLFPDIQVMIEFKNNQGKWHSKNVWQHTLQVIRNCPQKLEIRWAAFWHDCAKPQTYRIIDNDVHFLGHEIQGANMWHKVASCFFVDSDFKNYVYQLVEEHLQPSLLSSNGIDHCSDTALRRFANRLGDRMNDLFDLSIADITSSNVDRASARKNNCLKLKERINTLIEKDKVPQVKLPTGLGHVLIKELGLSPGRELGRIMEQLRQMLVEGKLDISANFAEEAKKILGEV